MPTNADLDARYTALLQSDPEIQRLSAQLKGMSGGINQGRALQGSSQQAVWNQIQQRAQQLGVPTDDWAVDWSGSGAGVDHQNWFERHPNVVAALALGGIVGPSVVGALAGGGAPAAGGSAAPSAAGTGAAAYGAPAPVIGGSAGTAGAPAYGGAVAGGGGSAAAAGSKFGQLAKIFKNPDVLNTAIQGVGGYFLNKSKQNAIEAARGDMQKATDEALRRNDEATAVAKGVYDTQRQDLAPYRQIGSSSIGALNTLMGFGGGGGGQAAINHPMTPQPGQPIAHPMTPQPGQPTGHPVPSLGQMGPQKPMQTMPQAATGMQAGANLNNVGGAIRLKAPDGEVRLVPRELAQQLIARGAVAV